MKKHRSSHRRCSVKKMLIEISQNSQTLVQVFSCEFCKASNNTFFHRTPPGDWFCRCTSKLDLKFHWTQDLNSVFIRRLHSVFMNDTFSKAAAETLYLYSPIGVFHVFKLYKWYQVAQSITYERLMIAEFRPCVHVLT